MTYQVRTGLSTAALAPLLRNTVQSIDRDLPVTESTHAAGADQRDAADRERAGGADIGLRVLALALACVGIYGIMAYSVAQRTNEIGIRLALGAQPGAGAQDGSAREHGLTLTGIVVGVGGALACTRLVQSMLYGVKPNDPRQLRLEWPCWLRSRWQRRGFRHGERRRCSQWKRSGTIKARTVGPGTADWQLDIGNFALLASFSGCSYCGGVMKCDVRETRNDLRTAR